MKAKARWYELYAWAVGLLVLGVPVGRMWWLSTQSPWVQAQWARPWAGAVVIGIVLCAVVTAWVVGRWRGPLVRPPHVAHVVAWGVAPRWRAFGHSLVRQGVAVMALGLTASTWCALTLSSGHLVGPAAAVGFASLGPLVGLLVMAAWLAGQVRPRWPQWLERVDPHVLVAQSQLWDQFCRASSAFDVSMASAVYREAPRGLRGAVASGRRDWTRLRADAVAAMRTPARLTTGLVCLVSGSALLATSAGWGPASPAVAAGAGVLSWLGIGSLTDGLRYAARAASAFPLFGQRDEVTVARHAVLPLLAGAGAAFTAAMVACAVTGAVDVKAGFSAVVVVAVCVVMRAAEALKGPLPLALMVEMPTPFGDPMPLVHLLWAMDATCLAALAGIAVVPGLGPVWLVLVVVVGAVILVRRWRRRGR